MHEFRNTATELFTLQKTCDDLPEYDPNLYFEIFTWISGGLHKFLMHFAWASNMGFKSE